METINLYIDYFSVIVTDKNLGRQPEEVFSSVADAEEYISNNYPDYHYTLDKDVMLQSGYMWDGDDYENHIESFE